VPEIHQAKTVRILIASPSDVSAERDIAEKIINGLEIPCERENLMIRPIAKRWETDVPALMGKSAQDIVNEWLVDDSACAVCIFWTRIGTPTDNAVGGAVEELERMLNAGKPVLLYFSGAPFSMADVDRKQLNALEDWKEKLFQEKRGLPKTYRNHHEFEKLLKADLETLLKSEFCDVKKRAVVPSQPHVFDLELQYRQILTEELGKIKMLGSPDIDSVQVRLDDTFVPLRISHTWKTDDRYSRRKREAVMREEMQVEMKPHSPDELMRRVFPEYRLLLVIGDPGAGKTTLMKYYALCCLQEQQERLFGDGGAVRVFFLPLRELKRDEAGQFRPLPEQLSVWSSARSNAIDPAVFDGWLRNAGGAKSLVLFDGLDEISDLELRKAACAWIDHQHSGFPATFFVVTSRLTGYRKTEGVELAADHIRADVMDFTQEQQAEFLSKWFRAAYCRELSPPGVNPEEWLERMKNEAAERAKTIVEYLNKPENRGLRELAAVPMMLQIMAILWKEREYLPGNRVKLYSAALDYLLEFRDQRRQIPPLLPADKARLVLSPVALWMQQELEADEAGRSAMHREMEKVLSTFDHPPSAGDFCRNLIDRAGLLVELGEERKEYLFRHKTFREYLAGWQLTEQIKRNSGMIAPLVEHFGEDWWNEPLTFFMAQADAGMFDRFMEELFNSKVSAEFSSKQQTLLQTIITEAPQKTIEALCRKLLMPDTTENRQRYILDSLKAMKKPDTVEPLQIFLQQRAVHESDVRSKAVDVLTTIDPEALGGITMVSRESHDALGAQYLLIPGGKYIYSVNEKAVSVPDLYVAKYPVTNRQYRSFVGFLAGKPEEHTKELSLKVYMQALQDLAHSGNEAVKGFDEYLKKESDRVRRFTSRYDDDRKFNRDDQPVVGVSWFDARAYCLWLSMLSGAEYRLPTEQEWEWAAGGRREEAGKVLKVKEYPWGDKPEPTPKHANFGQNEGSTTPVGRYPDGATPEGLYDMAGNVWEWMENWYDSGKKWKSLRGGSWYDRPVNLRCRARSYDFPDGRDGLNYGFRVVCPSPKMKI
jgi:formylglycine-generating enzyme required for sulfatase activity